MSVFWGVSTDVTSKFLCCQMSKLRQHNVWGKGTKIYYFLCHFWPDVFDEVRVHGHGWREWKVCSSSLQGWAEELHQGVPGGSKVFLHQKMHCPYWGILWKAVSKDGLRNYIRDFQEVEEEEKFTTKKGNFPNCKKQSAKDGLRNYIREFIAGGRSKTF